MLTIEFTDFSLWHVLINQLSIGVASMRSIQKESVQKVTRKSIYSKRRNYLNRIPTVLVPSSFSEAVLPPTAHRPLPTDFRLPTPRFTDYDTDYRPPTSTDHRPPITAHCPPTSDYRLPITDYRPPTTDLVPRSFSEVVPPTTDHRPRTS